jgi:hypothetical protein
MQARRSVWVAVSSLIAVGSVQAHAAPAKTCEVGHPVTIAGEISSVVAREQTRWSIWLNRASTDCALAAVVIEADALPDACRPGSRVTATGNFDGSDMLQSSLTSMSCEPYPIDYLANV